MPPSRLPESSPAAEFSAGRDYASELLKELSEPVQLKIDKPSTPATVARDVLIVLGMTLALRIPYFRGRMFPLNDGGMFAQIIDDIREAHFALPTHTTYNFLGIPLSYPPLAFYLGSLCAALTGQSTVSVLTWLPLVLNLMTVMAMYFIAREIYPSGYYACLAACCYASIGRSGEWLTMGGGLTRGLGILCAVIAILFFFRSQRSDGSYLPALSGIFVGLAILSHLEAGIFAALSLITLSILLPNRLPNMRRCFLAGGVAVLTVLPWMIWLYRHLGFGPLINAARTGGSYYSVRLVQWMILIASIILALVAQFPYYCWLAAIPFVMHRSGPTYVAVVNGLCMVWFANMIFVLLARRAKWLRRGRDAFLIFLAVGLSLQFSGIPVVHQDRLTDLRNNTRAQLSRAELESMRAAAQLTRPGAKFFVFSQRFGDWPTDMVAEWFPYFAKRQCVNTVQGREWLANNAFSDAIELQSEIEMSGSEKVTAKMLDELKPEYIFIAGPFDRKTRALDENQEWISNTVRAYAGSSPIYENAEVKIYPVHRSE